MINNILNNKDMTETPNKYKRAPLKKLKYKKGCLTIKNSYEDYYLTSKEEPVEEKDFTELSRDFNRLLMDLVIQGHAVHLPERLGIVKVSGKQENVKFREDGKIKGLSPNWKETKILWEKNPEAKERKQLIFNTNEHSSGIRYKFFWSKKRSPIQNKMLYVLQITRGFKRQLSLNIFAGVEYDSK